MLLLLRFYSKMERGELGGMLVPRSPHHSCVQTKTDKLRKERSVRAGMTPRLSLMYGRQDDDTADKNEGTGDDVDDLQPPELEFVFIDVDCRRNDEKPKC